MSSIEVSNVRTTEASLLGDQLDERHTSSGELPIGRVVGPADVPRWPCTSWPTPL
jgi:hypothetical protein